MHRLSCLEQAYDPEQIFVPHNDPFDCLHEAKYFSKLDLLPRYYQVRIFKKNEPKTRPFGLTNTLTTFYTLMNQVFLEYLDQSVIVYLDDILVYSSTMEEHNDHFQMVF